MTDAEDAEDEEDDYAAPVSVESSEESELDPEEGTSRDTSFTETLMSITRERSTQANLKPKSKSTKTQTDVLATSTFFHSKVPLVDKASYRHHRPKHN